MSDCYTIFKLVADKGGCKAASEIRAWTGIARAWNPTLMAQAKNVPTGVKTMYERHLLGYQNHISHGCEVRWIGRFHLHHCYVDNTAIGTTPAGV
jgi:hypothetical protein